jgi:hypothetical protein
MCDFVGEVESSNKLKNYVLEGRSDGAHGRS